MDKAQNKNATLKCIIGSMIKKRYIGINVHKLSQTLKGNNMKMIRSSVWKVSKSNFWTTMKADIYLLHKNHDWYISKFNTTCDRPTFYISNLLMVGVSGIIYGTNFPTQWKVDRPYSASQHFHVGVLPTLYKDPCWVASYIFFRRHNGLPFHPPTCLKRPSTYLTLLWN